MASCRANLSAQRRLQVSPQEDKGKRPQGIQKEEPQKVRRSVRLKGILRLQKSENRKPRRRYSSLSTEEFIESFTSSTIKGPKATPRSGTSDKSRTDRAASKTSSIFARRPFSRADSQSKGSQCYQRISEESYQSLGRAENLAKGVLSAGQYASPDCETEINGSSST